ncbi:MAG: ABC transporter ATP-binding protein, partial [Firmicutes bacterium]|nr:ABC transporter ATP-binding protein [Bacillota bacterium]
IDLLILDEHTAALDPKSSETVMDLTLKTIEEKNLTALMVTHNLRFATDYGTRIVMMHERRAHLDSYGQDKSEFDVDYLLKEFTQISIELGN